MFAWFFELLIKIVHSGFSTAFFIIVGVIGGGALFFGYSFGDSGDYTLQGIFMVVGVLFSIIFVLSVFVGIFCAPV